MADITGTGIGSAEAFGTATMRRNWTAPSTWADDPTLHDAGDFNDQIRDNLNYLKGQMGVPLIENKIQLEDMDATPVGDILIKVADETLLLRNPADDAYTKIAVDSLPAGTGAAEVSLGNHQHALSDDITGASVVTAVTGDTLDGTFHWSGTSINGSADSTRATCTTTFDTNAKVFAAAMVCGRALNADRLKVGVIMGGTLVAESAYIPAVATAYSICGLRALSGSQTCTATIHNYGATTTWYSSGQSDAATEQAAIAVVSFKASGAA